MTSAYLQAYERIQGAKNILLITHIFPDGDALGSLGFMCEWMSQLEKKYTAYTAGPLPSSLSFLPHYHQFTTDKNTFKLSDFDLIISLDCGSVARTNLVEEIKQRNKDQFFIEIDHHPSVEALSDLEIRETKMASTTELLYKISQSVQYRLNTDMARSLLTGILTDTGNFSFSATSQYTISSAATMLLKGASLSKIIEKTWRTKKIQDLKLWGIALSRLTKLKEYDMTYTVILDSDFKTMAADDEAVEGLAEFISSLPENKAVLVLREDTNGYIRGNLRTIRDDIDVGKLARKFGGGGHRKAAGFSLLGKLQTTKNGWRVET
jgi:phosphoesterase RecJ-like protein